MQYAIFSAEKSPGIQSQTDIRISIITTAKLRPLAFEQAGPFFYDATCKPSDCAVNGIQ